MSVALTNPLPNFAFSGNPIVAQLASDDVITTPGVAAVINLAFTGPVAAGDTIILNWTQRNQVLTAALDPDNSGSQFPAGDGSAAYVTSLAAFFNDNRNYYLLRDYVPSAAGINLRFTARKTGTDYNMLPVAGGNPVITLATAGVNQVLKANFQHALGVMLDDAQIYFNTLGLDYPATVGITTKDIAEILNPSLHHTVAGSDRPSLTANTWQDCGNSFKPYRIIYGQYYGDNPEVKRVYQSPVAYVNRGRLDTQTAVSQSLQGFLQPGGIAAKTLCLRQGSKIINMQPDQPEWLYWINFTGADQNIALRVQVNFTDGTSATPYLAMAFAAQANKKYYVPVSFDALNIAIRITDGKAVKSYQVRVCTTAGISLSDQYSYQFDRYREFARYFVYLNSLGGFQTLYTWGKGQDDTSRTKEDISKQVTATQAAISGRNLETNIRLQVKKIVNTGYTTEREIGMLKDFLSSEEKFAVENGRLVPIGISSDTLAGLRDGTNLNASQFEYYPLYDEQAYTDDPGQTDETINGGAGSGSGVTGGFDRIQDLGIKNNQIYRDF